MSKTVRTPRAGLACAWAAGCAAVAHAPHRLESSRLESSDLMTRSSRSTVAVASGARIALVVRAVCSTPVICHSKDCICCIIFPNSRCTFAICVIRTSWFCCICLNCHGSCSSACRLTGSPGCCAAAALAWSLSTLCVSPFTDVVRTLTSPWTLPWSSDSFLNMPISLLCLLPVSCSPIRAALSSSRIMFAFSVFTSSYSLMTSKMWLILTSDRASEALISRLICSVTELPPPRMRLPFSLGERTWTQRRCFCQRYFFFLLKLRSLSSMTDATSLSRTACSRSATRVNELFMIAIKAFMPTTDTSMTRPKKNRYDRLVSAPPPPDSNGDRSSSTSKASSTDMTKALPMLSEAPRKTLLLGPFGSVESEPSESPPPPSPARRCQLTSSMDLLVASMYPARSSSGTMWPCRQ
mmetsp:Transcript_3093/g.7253  ORF Transcript_3093/g.7253 Transcript_3093/m.7253 type:complete len:410 (+) Transcript_3093:94-1323(+)